VARDILVAAALFGSYGLRQGIYRAIGKAFVADFVPEHLRARGIGWDRVGHAAIFYYGATFSGAGSIGLLLLIPDWRPDGPREDRAPS